MQTPKNGRRDSLDEPLERAKDAALGAHHDHPSTADQIGEATGGIAGTLFGAGIGAAAGPIGAIIGGIAGALGGWWGGRAVAEATERITLSDDEYYRAHYESSADKISDRGFGDVRAAYYLGQIARRNPEYANRQFEDIEPELARGWASYGDTYGTWQVVRSFAREGYERSVTEPTDHAPAGVPGEVAPELKGGIDESVG